MQLLWLKCLLIIANNRSYMREKKELERKETICTRNAQNLLFTSKIFNFRVSIVIKSSQNVSRI